MWQQADRTEKSTYTVPERPRGREAEAKTQRQSNREEEEHQKREERISVASVWSSLPLLEVCKAIFICAHLYSRHLQVPFPGTMNSRVAWKFGMVIPFSYVW